MPPSDTLQEALALSESMYRAGADGRWEEVRGASDRRDWLLRSALSPIEPPYRDSRELLERLAYLDRELMSLAKDRRHHCQTQALENAKARKATNAYADIRGLPA